MHLMYGPEGESFVFPRILIKTNFFPEGPDLSTFVVYLELQQTSGACNN